MNSHKLAEILLLLPDKPIAVSANNHEAFSDLDEFNIGSCRHYRDEFIMIGNMTRKDLNSPNWYITDFIDVQDGLDKK